ncbi:MAG: hypothetical protein COV72_07675 [Candidatus Omnitrophica bacterium CG11_big_fil_rev_8_21_14_0_20_42_13]|uniref:N-acetylmuramoyl-L-alanine amidase n=1 Tax=Candidatus Ghiorseimicrobium undicola TaxID=1974746 RepID=A0A2H0LW35_9BACT|nr:MAG: hypothetical protein COV72_07675 [Candidatus Omnitrophica bacterium CG11_big_fil_rev_8_21_14_0_20_42_13]
MYKRNRTKVILSLFLLFAVFLPGCASSRPLPLDNYSVNILNLDGRQYLPLLDICRKESISWAYDHIAGVFTLAKDGAEAKLMLDSSAVLVGADTRNLKFPFKMHKGEPVISNDFTSIILNKFSSSVVPLSKKRPSYYNIKRICLDAGHGGKDPGAVGAKFCLKEKDVNLDIAKRMKKELERQGIEVIMTRSDDTFIPLDGRCRIANEGEADLFISVHSNANKRRSMSGFEVYYISDSADDSSRALALASDRNSLSVQQAGLYFDKKSAYGISKSMQAIIWDLILAQNRPESVELAHHICKLCSDDIGVKVLGVKGANFLVLKNTHMPAILVEVGFISNAREEKFLKNSFYRQQIAESLAAGILSYKRHVENTY